MVTSGLADGQLTGITVTAFTSLSLDPPLVLICIDKRWIHDQLAKGGHFAVNMLAEDQEFVPCRFATHEEDPFRELGYSEGITGTPVLHGSLAAIECLIVDVLAGGDHNIFVGQVEATHVREGKPLMYFRGGYTQMG